jgi:capsular polysaccharide transport system permease protein
LLRLLKIQFQVLRALTLRDIQSQQANLAYGFGWVFVDALMSFAGLLILRVVIKGFSRPGVPIIMFLISGLIPWLMFNACLRLPEGTIKRGRSLLQLPIITELDLVLASTLRIFLTFTILFVVLAMVDTFYEGVPSPRFPLGISLLFISMCIMGIGLGFILMVLSRLYAPAGKFVSFFLRFGTLFSGVVFQVTSFPPTIWPYLTWNPMLHVEELLRTYWFYSYHTPVGSPLYVAESLTALTFFGLLLERYARRRLPA